MTATLAASIEAILDGLVSAIQAQVNAPATPLGQQGILAVVRGDRARPMPALPSIWVVPQIAMFSQHEFDAETWAMPVSLAALVKSDDPAAGGTSAQTIAALARTAALTARPSGAEIIDIRSQSYDPTARSSERNRTLFWTDAIILVTFSVSG